MIEMHFRRLAKLASLVAIAGAAPVCEAAVMETATVVHITQFFTYPQVGTGDVAIMTDSVQPGCEGGFWITKSDTGFNATYAAVLMAYTTKNPVWIWYDNSQLWSGATAHTCKIYAFNPV